MIYSSAQIRRSKAKFGLVAAAIGLLTFLILLEQHLVSSVEEGLTGMLTAQSGEVVVFSSLSSRELFGSLITPAQLDAVRREPGVAAAAELGVTSRGARSRTSPDPFEVTVVGYRPGQPGEVTRVVAGRLPASAGEVVASEEDARGRYRVDEEIVVEPGAVPLRVVGLTARSRYAASPTLLLDWDAYQVLMERADLDPVLRLPSVVAVRPDPGTAAEALAARLSRAVVGVDATTREEAAATSPSAELLRLPLRASVGVTAGLVAALLSCFFLALVAQARPSLEVLHAVGAGLWYLVRGVVQQLVVVATCGFGAGALLLVVTLPVTGAIVPLRLAAEPFVVAGVVLPLACALAVVAPVRLLLRIQDLGAGPRGPLA